jgi:hypothetical protein
MRGLFLFLAAVSIASGQSHPSEYPYLVRLEHSTFENHACALLQTTGAFHLEIYVGEDVRVFEGTVPTNDLLEIEGDLNSETLVDLSQQQIEEPLIRTRHDELQVTVLRGDDWQDLFFRSSDSQKPYERWLQPLTRWLDGLHKLPHRELSEDEGKNNCLPPKPITLKKRDTDALPAPVSSKANTHILSAGPSTQPEPQPAQPVRPRSIPALLRVYSFEMQTGSAHESCVLLGENGVYRFEDRTQKTGKPVNNRIVAGKIKPDELHQLHQLLDQPTLAKLKHHEPPGGMVVPMMGDMIEITVSRSDGIQHLILSSRFNRAGLGPFYRGDEDSSKARPLLKFLSEHVENNPAGILDPSKRNGCSEAP